MIIFVNRQTEILSQLISFVSMTFNWMF